MAARHTSVVRTALWTLFWLVLIDLGLNALMQVGQHRQGGLLSLARYLDYGRSIEGKIDQALAHPGSGAERVLSAGWLDPAAWRHLPSEGRPGQPLVAVYGQSFTFRAMEQVDRQSPDHWVMRKIGGPAAPLTHSLAAYRLDTARARADWVVVGVLGSSMKRANALSGLSDTFEAPAPFTYPALQWLDSRWVWQQPTLLTYSAFVEARRADGAAWRDFKQQVLRANPALDRWAFEGAGLDASALVRLARRGWVNSLKPEGEAPDLLRVHQEALRQMQAQAETRQERLLVILFSDRASPEEGMAALAQWLAQQGIPFVDSRDIIDPRNAHLFEADGHFRSQYEAELARAVALKMQRQ